ncbi:MAG: hypothetical protein K0Q69_1957, partial [Devosia sp.]|nr:hypothetical protein [Devosia sp.]
PFAGFHVLGENETFFDGTKAPLTWSFDGGNYRMGYFVEKRLNQPVK